MSARRVINGTPGTRWRNDTKKVRWQAVVSWQNSCGRCIANDHAISTSKWPFPRHRMCRCVQIPIYPGQESLPFVDFRDEIDKLPAHRRQHVIGKAALALVDNHVLRWPDVVLQDRIRSLNELVARYKLTVERMTAAGVDRRTAQAAFDQAHGHDGDALAEAHRKAMAAEVAAKAEQQRQAREATKARLAAAEAQLEARPKAPKPVATAVEAGSARVLADYLRRAKVKISSIENVIEKRFGKINAEAEVKRLKEAEAKKKAAAAAPKPAPAPPPPATPKLAAPTAPAPKPPPTPKPAPAPAVPAVPAWKPRPMGDFEEIRDPNKIEEWGKRVFEPWADALSSYQKPALRQYTGDNYKWMNGLLRGDPSELHRIAPMLSEAEAMKTVNHIDAALRRGKTDRDLVMFRGVKDVRAMGIDPATIQAGDKITMQGFASATLKEDVGIDFATKGDVTPHTFMLKINVPEGSTGGYLNAGEFSGYAHEREFLMPHDTKYRFVKTGGKVKDRWGTDIPVLVLERIE